MKKSKIPPPPPLPPPNIISPNNEPHIKLKCIPVDLSPPVVKQPQWGSALAKPAGPSDFPVLSSVDELIIKFRPGPVKGFPGDLAQNKFVILDPLGETVLYAGESSDCCSANWCLRSRSFHLRILNQKGETVVIGKKAPNCASMCFPFCPHSMVINTPEGPIGSIKQRLSAFYDRFEVMDEKGRRVLWIQGPCRRFGFCPEPEIFKILSNDGKELGMISRAWPGFTKETGGINVGVSFPKEMNDKVKALVLAAVFMVDILYLESFRNVKGYQKGKCCWL